MAVMLVDSGPREVSDADASIPTMYSSALVLMNSLRQAAHKQDMAIARLHWKALYLQFFQIVRCSLVRVPAADQVLARVQQVALPAAHRAVHQPLPLRQVAEQMAPTFAQISQGTTLEAVTCQAVLLVALPQGSVPQHHLVQVVA